MPKPLVIVESPAKAKTIAGFLGSDYVVESSIGHIRDLPRNAADVPAAYKGEPWARLGVDVDNDFKPLYVVSPEKRDQVRKLKALLKDASELYLATDEDREGESIAWHLLEVLAPRVPVKRMVFHEITRPAIERAVAESRDLDRRLVDAQETRRILDRLYGYEVSPVLWKKVMRNLSAGRVQSVEVRLLVERERARMRFRMASYWDIAGRFVGGRANASDDGSDPVEFGATLVSVDGERLATGKDFGEDGRLVRSDVFRLDEDAARVLVARLESSAFTVRAVQQRPWKRSPAAPFMTSTLQQEAGRKLRFPSARTMRVAQNLYESGFITYMRTDSTTLSDQALSAARSQAGSLYGSAYVPSQPRRYDKKVKNAQEAHEAIRPAGEEFRTPEQTGLTGDARRLYELVWMRTVASQMADATGQSVQVRLGAVSAPDQGDATVDAEFATSGRTISFPGFLRAYVEGSDDPDAELGDRETPLPILAVGATVGVRTLDPSGHETQPPARYTEASLVKALEELGVGRPSTYSATIDTIQSRGYVWKKGPALVPSWTAFAVTGLLEQYFGKLVDYGFTASMEEDLDEIARGAEEAVPWLSRFYFGTGQAAEGATAGGNGSNGSADGPGTDGPGTDGPGTDGPGTDGLSIDGAGLKRLVEVRLGEIDAREVNSIPIGLSENGTPVVVRVGRYGPYVQRGQERTSVPEDIAPDELTMERAIALLEAGSSDRTLGKDPENGLDVIVKAGRFGPYVQVGESDDVEGKPKTASLLSSMDPATITFDDALKVLTLPRTVGVEPASGEAIEAHNGRYGPYLRKGSDSRSLESEEHLFSTTLEQALALFAQAKTRRGQSSQSPLRELGPDPATSGIIQLRDGRFGPYVTDGETNASLRKGDVVDSLTPERAAELLADRRAAGPSKKRSGARKAPAKKAGAKKAGPKKAGAKKTAAKRTGVKKTAARKTGPQKAGPQKAGPQKAGTQRAGARKTASPKASAQRSGAPGTGPQEASTTRTASESAGDEPF
ncbi:MAG: type I DNA topoisomerase [Actinomycetota bacterium]|nr:type I DNA topoisomerase [Actinomycetota bacterium]